MGAENDSPVVVPLRRPPSHPVADLDDGRRRVADERTQRVLDVFLADPKVERYGLAVARLTGLGSGTLYPILDRLEQDGWLTSRSERANSRKRRHRLYRLARRDETTGADRLTPVVGDGEVPVQAAASSPSTQRSGDGPAAAGERGEVAPGDPAPAPDPSHQRFGPRASMASRFPGKKGGAHHLGGAQPVPSRLDRAGNAGP